MEMLDQLASDCRKEIRAEVCQRGRLVTSWQQYGILVVVSDVSRFGARIMLNSPTKLPPTFELWLDDEGVVHPSRICWRLHNQIGVEFTGHARAATMVRAEFSRFRVADSAPEDMLALSQF